MKGMRGALTSPFPLTNAIMQRLIRRWNRPGGYRQVFSIAFPLILSTGTWSVQHFVDRIFLAWYSPETIAASGPAGFLNFTLISLFTGTVGFVAVFVAQYYGAGKLHRIGPVLWQSLYISIIGGIFLLSLIPVSSSFFNFVGHDPLVRFHEIRYFNILCLGGFPVIAASAFSPVWEGHGPSCGSTRYPHWPTSFSIMH
jgi:MATE family multidrug resistance protein